MSLKLRLTILNFIEFAVWGAYLTCMGNYLGSAGMGSQISWFYAIQGIVSIFMPTLMGIVADRWIQPQRLLGLCHLVAGASMLGLWWMAQTALNAGGEPNHSLFIALYTLSVAFYMPTLALANTTAFTLLKTHGYDTIKDFPPIRVLGTVGFIATMWFVNCAVLDDNGFSLTLGENAFKFQYTHWQFFVSGALSILMFVYSYTLPPCVVEKKAACSLSEAMGLNAFKLFGTRQMALFFIFSAMLGMSLQVTNGYAGPFLTSFKGSADAAVANSFAANNATLLTSISQISEALCILLIPFFLRRFGIKTVMLMAMMAWVFRFGFFGAGSPTMPGLILFVLSCIVYGVAFDFFNVSGAMFVDQECAPDIRASAQGLFMLMTNGLGATIGTLSAGAVVNRFCHWENGYFVGDWSTCWYIFAGFALTVAVLFDIFFKKPKKA